MNINEIGYGKKQPSSVRKVLEGLLDPISTGNDALRRCQLLFAPTQSVGARRKIQSAINKRNEIVRRILGKTSRLI